MGSERRAGFRSAWGSTNFRRLLLGMVVTGTGTWLYNVAVLAYALQVTGSSGWVAAIAVAKLLPVLLFGALGGALADRYERRRVMVSSDLVRAAVMLALAGVVASDASMFVVALLVAVDSFVSTPYYPAVGAMTPELVEEDDLAAANALTGVVDNLTITLGPALGSLLLLTASAEAAIGLNALTFLVSALFVSRISLRSSGSPDSTAEPVLRQISDGLGVLRHSADLMLLTLIGLGFTITFGMEIVLYPLISDELLGLGTDGLGWLLAASGLGGVLGTWVASRLAAQPASARILVGFAMLTALPLLSLIVVKEPAVAMAVLLVEGVGFVVGDVISVTTIQRVAPKDVLGRLFGLFDTLFVVGILVGSLLAGALVGSIGLTGTMALASGILFAVALAAVPRARRLDQLAADRANELADRVRFFESIRIFDGASRTTLESIASSAERESVAVAAVVVSEGEPSDAFYLIRSGTFRVLPVAVDLGPGQYFGEIGVLEGIPRTATVTSITEGELYRIDPDNFLQALNEAPAGRRRLADTLAGRLATTRPTHRPRFTGTDTAER